MKKIVVALMGAFLSCGIAFAGQFNWDAGEFDSTFKNGTGYLVQMTEGSASISDIYDAIVANGVSATTPEGFKLWGTGSVTEDSGSYNIDTVSQLTTAGAYEKFFVIVLSEDGTKFAIYEDFNSVTVDDVRPTDMSFGALGSTEGWTVGTVGSVPEPTVLALLALGVAGLALKRRVA